MESQRVSKNSFDPNIIIIIVSKILQDKGAKCVHYAKRITILQCRFPRSIDGCV